MRLICPNCGAQYEVDASVIPDQGRDVQCSNCGHTWYQRAAAKAVPEEAPPAAEAAETALTAPEAAAETEAAAEIGTGAETGAEAEAEAAEMAENEPPEDEDMAAEEPPRTEPARSALDPEVSGILREEAARERAERAVDQAAAAIELQPDLGLESSGAEVPPNVKERMARLRELDDELGITAAAAPVAAHRKDLLPDIEEINSSLTPDTDRDDEADLPEPVLAERARRSGFRRGFVLVILVFAVMALVYLYAPKIVQLNPQTEPVLAGYVDWVNRLREGLNGFMANTAERLTALLASINSDG